MKTELQVGGCRIELLQGDITAESTDAIVNAANSGLMGGGFDRGTYEAYATALETIE